MSESDPMSHDPNKPHRKVTIAIVEKTAAETIRYSVLEPTDYPYQLVESYLDDFAKEMVSEMGQGEERAFLLYEQAEGLRPTVKDVRIINAPKTIKSERSVMGQRGSGVIRIKTVPYSVENGKSTIVKRGAFPTPEGGRSALFDDDGIDENAIRTAALRAHSLLRTAIAEKFSESSRLALTAGLDELIRSTGTTGDPREDWDSDAMDETAVNLFDAAIFLWLESEAANTLPIAMSDGYRNRLSEDPERLESIRHIAKAIENGRSL